jgi:hypothetical protein
MLGKVCERDDWKSKEYMRGNSESLWLPWTGRMDEAAGQQDLFYPSAHVDSNVAQQTDADENHFKARARCEIRPSLTLDSHAQQTSSKKHGLGRGTCSLCIRGGVCIWNLPERCTDEDPKQVSLVRAPHNWPLRAEKGMSSSIFIRRMLTLLPGFCRICLPVTGRIFDEQTLQHAGWEPRER